MLRIGIVGLPNVGKSSLFQTLTKKQVDIQNYPFTTIEPNVGVVTVPDQRLGTLSRLSNSAKTIPTAVEFVDIAGLVKGAAQGEGLGNKFLSHIREVDAIAQIVRCFQNPEVIHVSGAPNPIRDIETINLELALADLQTAEKILEKARQESKSGDAKKAKRVSVLEKIIENLKKGAMANAISLETADQELIKNVQLLTAKPTLIVLNIDENSLTNAGQLRDLQKRVSEKTAIPEKSIVAVAIKLEKELSELSDQEQIIYKKESGLEEIPSGIDLLIRKGYELLDLITFFTTGEDETRAWTVQRGATAPEAGGKIHSDFQEKFIRAEVIPYPEFVKIGSWSKARDLGALKTVGKDYVVQDGDIIEFRI